MQTQSAVTGEETKCNSRTTRMYIADGFRLTDNRTTGGPEGRDV